MPRPALCEKCQNTEFFLVLIQENTDEKKLRIWTLFTQCSNQERPSFNCCSDLLLEYICSTCNTTNLNDMRICMYV